MDLESTLLSHLQESDNIRLAWTQNVTPETFVNPLNRRVYEFTLEYWHQSRMEAGPTLEVLSVEFPEFTPQQRGEETTHWLVEAIKERHIRNQLQDAMLEAARLAQEDPKKGLKTLFSQTSELIGRTASRVGRADLSTNLQERRDEYREMTLNSSLTVGAPIGLREVDEHFMGTLPGELTVVSGYAKAGKSWFLLQSAIAARRAGYTPLIVTLELSTKEMWKRYDAMISGVSYNKLLHARLDIPEIDRVHAAQEEMAALGSMYLEKPPEGERTVRHIFSRAQYLEVDYLIIDQLSHVETRRQYNSQKDAMREKIVDLKITASQDESQMLPVLLAAQLNRASQEKVRDGRAVGLEDNADAVEIEQTLDGAFAISQTREMAANRSLRLDITGHRRAETKSWLIGRELVERTEMLVRQEIVS